MAAMLNVKTNLTFAKINHSRQSQIISGTIERTDTSMLLQMTSLISFRKTTSNVEKNSLMPDGDIKDINCLLSKEMFLQTT